MKMEHRISAPADGVVTELPVVVGQQVEVGSVLAVVGDAVVWGAVIGDAVVGDEAPGPE
jgi:propionyl-CoA carboxylase alpha chain